MMKTAALLALAPGVAASVVNRNFLSADMQPDVVARTLVKVENGWMSEATTFAHCSSEGGDCSESSELFTKSCSQVVNSVVQGSNGDKARTAEYMEDVCGQKALAGWHKATCLSLRKALSQKMGDSVFDNRENFNVKKVCDVTWTNLVDQQKKEVLKEIAMHKEEEKKEQEEEAKQAEQKKADDKKAQEESIKKAKEAEAEAEAKEKEMKAEEEKRKEQEKKEETKDDVKFDEAKKEIEDVEKASGEKLEEADAVEKDTVKVAVKVDAVKVETKVKVEAPKPVAAVAKPVAAVAKPVAGKAQLKEVMPAVVKVAAAAAAKPVVAVATKPAVAKAVSGIHVNKIQPKADDSVDKKDDEKVNNKPHVTVAAREEMRAIVKVHKEVNKIMAGEKATQTKLDAAEAGKQSPIEGTKGPEKGKEAGWEVDAYVKAKKKHDGKKQKDDERKRWADAHARSARSREVVNKYRDKVRAEQKKQYEQRYKAAVEKIKKKEAKKAEKKAAEKEAAESAAPSLAAPGILLTSLLLCASVMS